MTVAVGFSPRELSAITKRRGATLEGLDWLFGSSVAPRRAPFPTIFRGLKPTATITLSLRDCSKSEMRPLEPLPALSRVALNRANRKS